MGCNELRRHSANRGRLLVLETLTAQDRPALGRFERNRRLDPALRTSRSRLRTRDARSGRTGTGTRRGCPCPFKLAGLAPLRVVLKLFVEEKELFAGSEDELSTAICTGEDPVYKFHNRVSRSAEQANAQRNLLESPVSNLPAG